MKIIVVILVQVLLCIVVTAAKLHIIDSSKSEDIFNQTENNLNDTLDNNTSNNNNKVDNEDDAADNDAVDLITSTDEQQIKNIAAAVATAPSSLLTAYGLATTTNQRPSLRQQVAEGIGQSPESNHHQPQHHGHRLAVAALKSNNDNLKLNKLKAFTKDAVIEGVGIADGAFVDVRGLQQQSSFETNTYNGISTRGDKPNSVVHADIEATDDNNHRPQLTKQQPTPQQVNHLKMYNSNNSLPPLSFGQLPQLLQQPSAPLASPLQQVYHDNHHFADYRYLFNAERYTEFSLYTLTKDKRLPPGRMMTRTPHEAITAMTNATVHGRVLHVVSDTIGAAFGVNARPVAGMHGIHRDELELYNARSLRQSRFNPFNPTRILIHGWLGGSTAGIFNTLIPEFLKLKDGTYNIITVDWGKGAIADYITASYHVKPVGKVVAKFIDFLHRESGTQFENIHVIGFSMGAHVAGMAGKHVQTGRLPVIYALDPALPLFRYENINERVDRSDADYVEVIHSSVGSYGYDRPLGHVDFYVNYGSSQPGCYFNECSHFRGFQIFAQSLYNEVLEGIGCSAEMWAEMIKRKKCSKETGHKLTMTAENLNKSTMADSAGVYYVLTNPYPPYKK